MTMSGARSPVAYRYRVEYLTLKHQLDFDGALETQDVPLPAPKRPEPADPVTVALAQPVKTDKQLKLV